MIGRSLSHFEITAKLGEGGMGEVWRARDTRLEREVAIKVLPAAFIADSERRARFEREAKVLASLNHPNVGGIYDLVESGGSRALVLELVEGPTLAERIAQGPIPIDEALPIARQIAEALEAAHALGIVHRDLKPANIKITSEGNVKVLDFGLAKALRAEPEPEAAGLSQSPTIGHATQLGMIIGTPSYMAPEQARGLPTDKRADIWAFGCVLYEMLTGASPFGGATDSDTLAAVLRAEPSWQPLPEATPLAVRRLLERCLRKEVERRLRDAGDARLELEDAEREPDAAAGSATSAHTRRRGVWWPVVAVLATILALGLLVERLIRPQAAQRPVEFEIHPPPGTVLSTWLRARPVVSPDGSHVVFSVMEESGARLWVRRLDDLEAWPLEGTESAVGKSWSSDGRQIAFSATSWRGLRKMDVGGGASELLTREAAMAASWSRAGDILTSFPNGPLRRVFAGEGGWTSEPLSSLDPSTMSTPSSCPTASSSSSSSGALSRSTRAPSSRR
jgi:serine/threonine protein kinase